MPIEPGANIVDELTKPETPIVETPPAEAAPITEPAKPEGTPSQEDPVVTPQVEPKPEGKTPEQIEADKKFFQQKYQETRAKLDTFEREILPFDEKPTTEPSPQATKPAQPTMPVNRFEGMSQEQMDGWVAEHPVETILALQQQTKADILSALDEREKTRDAQAKQKYEKEYVTRVLDDFMSANKVTDEERTDAVSYVREVGRALPPRTMGRLFADRVNYQRAINHVVQTAQETQVKVAQQTRQQLLATQPDNGTTPLTGDQSLTTQIAAKFKASKEGGIVSELIG
jgi:hypothetical protein